MIRDPVIKLTFLKSNLLENVEIPGSYVKGYLDVTHLAEGMFSLKLRRLPRNSGQLLLSGCLSLVRILFVPTHRTENDKSVLVPLGWATLTHFLIGICAVETFSLPARSEKIPSLMCTGFALSPREMKSSCSGAERQSEALMAELCLRLTGSTLLSALGSKKTTTKKKTRRLWLCYWFFGFKLFLINNLSIAGRRKQCFVYILCKPV